MSEIKVEVSSGPEIKVSVEADCDVVLQVQEQNIGITVEDEITQVEIIEPSPVEVSVQGEKETIVVEEEAPPLVIEVAPVGPTSVDAETYQLEAGETLSAGNYVNVYQDGLTTKVRKADASLGRQADGFTKVDVLVGQIATIYLEGLNDQLTGLVPSSRYYLGNLGNATTTPTQLPGAQIHQFLGVAISNTILKHEIEDFIHL